MTQLRKQSIHVRVSSEEKEKIRVIQSYYKDKFGDVITSSNVFRICIDEYFRKIELQNKITKENKN